MIRSLRPSFPGLSLHRMCAVLSVSRSLVYRSAAPRGEPELLAAAERIATEHLGYGYRRVLRALRAEGFELGEHRVRRLLRENGLLASRPRRRSRARPGPLDRSAANLLKGLEVERCDQAWGADVTLVRTVSGPLYLAAMLDLRSRRVVGWSLSRRCDEALAAACLKKALEARRPPPGWIHHSDQGSVYTAAGYARLVREAGGRQSLSAPGRPRDNAKVESFFRTLKLEEAGRGLYESFAEAEAALERYIERVYNSTRMHSALEYMSPDQFEARQNGAPR